MTSQPADAAGEEAGRPVDALTVAVAGLGTARAQIDDVVSMLEQGRGLEEIVTALVDVSTAIDRAGFAVISTGLRECVVRAGEGGGADTAALERLFRSLA